MRKPFLRFVHKRFGASVTDSCIATRRFCGAANPTLVRPLHCYSTQHVPDVTYAIMVMSTNKTYYIIAVMK